MLVEITSAETLRMGMPALPPSQQSLRRKMHVLTAISVFPAISNRHLQNAMKPHYLHRVPPKDTPGLIATLILSLALLVIVMLLTSCGGTFVLMPDGTVSYTTPAIVVPSK